MSHLNPDKLHVKFSNGFKTDAITPRAYTLTHSDSTGDLYLTIGAKHNLPQISGWYSRLMRDEVLAEWRLDPEPSLHVHCHVSGGLIFGPAGWRASIFRRHLPMVLIAFHYGDQNFLHLHPELEQATVWIHFHARQKRYNQVENWGKFGDYRFTSRNQPAVIEPAAT